ncbi:hypothetical protein ACFWMU_19360 [Streptomyces sp. NPDC058357]|uniref:hypothetical protein n=1 Tax=unclassified Streptomyces TaxID=2593676 RepID=UPI00366077D0
MAAAAERVGALPISGRPAGSVTGSLPLPRALLPATIVVVLVLVLVLVLVWFPAVALFVDRLSGWLRRSRTARAVGGGSGAALTVLGSVLVTGPLLR